MNAVLEWVEFAGEALLRMALNPFYYIGLILVALLCRRQTLLERKLFFVRIHSMLGEFLKAAGWCILIGLLVSLASAGFGLDLTLDAVLWVWGITLVLLLARIRYASLAYAAGIVGLLHEAARLFPRLEDKDGIQLFVESLLNIHLPSLFALVALLLLAEAGLARIQSARSATPMYVEGKRGKVVGAYQLQGLWAMPLFLVVPEASGDGMSSLPWQMFFGEGWDTGWTLLAFPALIGFSDVTVSELPARRVKRIVWWLIAFAIIMAALSVIAELWSFIAVVAAIASLGIHETWVIYEDRRERNQSPVFVHETRGLKVLDVMPGSPAAEMGIVRGETILKANGFAVASKEELHAALRTNSAFCKLEILNLDGQNKFEHRALFDGEHHQLGIVLCPDDKVVHYIEWRPLTLFSLFGVKRKGRFSESPVQDEQPLQQEHGSGI